MSSADRHSAVAQIQSGSAAPDSQGVLPGYRPLPAMSGYMAGFGILYQHETTKVFGAHHLNNPGVAHGGMFATFADPAIGIA